MVTEHEGWVYEKYFSMTNGRNDFEEWFQHYVQEIDAEHKRRKQREKE